MNGSMYFRDLIPCLSLGGVRRNQLDYWGENRVENQMEPMEHQFYTPKSTPEEDEEMDVGQSTQYSLKRRISADQQNEVKYLKNQN